MRRKSLLTGISVFSALVLGELMNPAETVNALENATYLQSFKVDGSTIAVYAAGDDSSAPDTDQVEITLGDQELALSSVENCENESVTWYCVIDRSGSIGKERFKQEKQALQSLADNMGQEDNMVICTMGDTIDEPVFMDDQQEIAERIDALEVTEEDTLLYTAVCQGIDTLTTSSEVKSRSCLILLTDGQDDNTGSYTQAEAEKAVTDSHIPVYTVAVMAEGDQQDAARVESAKLLGSFSRMSAGGEYYNLLLDSIKPSDAAREIQKDLKSDLLICAELPGTELTRDAYRLEVTIRTQKEEYTDSLTVYSSDLKDSVKKENPENESESETNEKIREESEETFPTVYVILAAVVILILVFLILFLFWKKKKQREEKEKADQLQQAEQIYQNSSGNELPISSDISEISQNSENVSAPEQATEYKIGMEDNDIQGINGAEKMYTVHFLPLHHPEYTDQVVMKYGETMTFGRSSWADHILNTQDGKLSGVHFRLQCMGSFLRAWDMDSTNGTSVNGVLLEKEKSKKVVADDVLKAGNYQYRITITEME